MSFACPSCGEEKNLKGRREGELVRIACGTCGHKWSRDPWACPRCGERMHAVRKPLLQKARGTQQSIIGFSTVKECRRCDPEEEQGPGWLSAT